MNKCLVIFILLVFSFAPSEIQAEDITLIQRKLEKVVGTGTLFSVYESTECGELLDALPKMVKEINLSIAEVKSSVEPRFPEVWKKVTAPDSKINQDASKWVTKRIEKVKDISANKDFGCGMIFGELLNYGYKFERYKVSLMMALKNHNKSK